MILRIILGLLGAILGYLAGLFATIYLYPSLTPNRHDAPVEVAMTGTFVIGPSVGLFGAVAGVVVARVVEGWK